jgi:hypothetical protein
LSGHAVISPVPGREKALLTSCTKSLLKDLMVQIKKGKAKNVKSHDFEEVAKELGI